MSNFGQFYHGDYVFRNLLNVPPFEQHPGLKNLSGIQEYIDLWDAILADPHTVARIQFEGQVITERANRLLHEYGAMYHVTAAKISSIQKINVKVANFLMDQLNAEQVQHEPIVRGLSSELTGVADVDVLQDLTNRLESALSILKDLHDRTVQITSMPPDKIEAMTPDMLTRLGTTLKYLVYGVVALAAVKYLPGIIKSFRK